MNHQNNCTNRHEAIAAYVLGLLEQKDAAELKKHLETCRNCQSLYQTLLNEEQEIRSTFQMVADKGEAVQESLIKKFEQQKPLEEEPKRIFLLKFRTILKSPLTKFAAAVIFISIIILHQLGGSMEGVAWAKVVENVERIESFIFQHQISLTNVADGIVIQESETTTYVSSVFGLRQDAYINDQVVGISYIPPAGTIVTQVMPVEKKYRKVSTSEEYMKQIHNQVDPKGMIREFMSFKYTELGRKIVDGVEAEGIEVNDPRFLNSVFESAVGRLWVDVVTELPVRTEIKGISRGGSIETKIVAYDFNWDVQLEPGIFEPNVPDDYTLLEK
jgi:hypothetical protein